MPSTTDIFGLALLGYWQGKVDEPLRIHREDGLTQDYEMSQYFCPEPGEWERYAIAAACGTVIDVGCGAGRTTLALQKRGISTVGVDCSPHAVSVATARGSRDVRQFDVMREDWKGPGVDTIMLFGNNIGLAETWEGTRELLRRLRRLSRPGASLWCDGIDIEAPQLTLSVDLSAKNRAAGRPPGQISARCEYAGQISEPSGWIFLSTQDLASLAAQSGWRVTDVWGDGADGAYMARLTMTGQ